VDANQGYTLQEAVDFARRAAEITPLRWFEEPCRWYNDRRMMRDVRLKAGVAVAAGQSEISRHGVRELIAEGAIDVSNYDASWGGGPTEWRKVAMTAEVFGVELGHHEEAQVASHLLASRPNSTYVESFRPERDPIFWQMIANRPELQGGEFPLPDRPGFGWELDPDFVEHYRADR
jgi:D-galactarolactone cycloisomerase